MDDVRIACRTELSGMIVRCGVESESRDMVRVESLPNVEHRHLLPPTSPSLNMTATISKGTLNLRFMQKSLSAGQELETESVGTIATKDESHWEVAKEVRDMWGMSCSEPSSR